MVKQSIMSEFAGDEYSQFFEAEALREHEKAEARARIDAISHKILTVLDENEAIHVWHPDKEQADLNVAQAAADIEASEDFRREVQEWGVGSLEAVKIRMIAEVGIIYAIESAMILKAHGSTLAEEAQDKKRVLTQLQINGFDEGWQRTVDSLLEGPLLDLTKEEDLRLYVEESLHEPEGPAQSLAYAVRSTLLNDIETRDLLDQAHLHQLVLVIFNVFMKATYEPSSLPTAQAYIDELQRDGSIDEAQAGKLREILRDSIHKQGK